MKTILRPSLFACCLAISSAFVALSFPSGAVQAQTQTLTSRSEIAQKPDPAYFDIDVLATGLADPMELDVAPDGKVFIIERAGAVKVYDPATSEIKQIARLAVECRINPPGPKGNDWAREDGLLGLALDPQFADNSWLYLYYSVAGEEEIARLSRFTFEGDTLNMDSEKILLVVPSERGGNTCHMGGCLQFDRKGNLFLTTGDNTNPFQSDGYNPIDERPDRRFLDAQRSAGNSMDLRGKILRIKPEPDGSYTIPPGNLFPPGMPRTRPEIYVMGNRNPFRLSVDDQTGFIYWGEVGPDARDNSDRGPAGHDELNQARRAGYFGWPYFVGNNEAYADHDFATGKNGARFDPGHPRNDAPRNTGMNELPPAQPAFLWYPYTPSAEFPELGEGGRNAMAGPVYHYEGGENRFPSYYDNQLFFYDWMRGKIWNVKLDESGDYMGMEVFLNGLVHPVDLEFGPDGAMYLLEYGSEWYFNVDGRVKKIQFSGWNRRPVVQLAANRIVGKTPTTIQFTGDQSFDPDHDEISYHWDFGLGDEVKATIPNPSATFDHPGRYEVTLTVRDAKGKATSGTLELVLGNAMPEVDLKLLGADEHFEWGQTLEYKVEVSDEEDGSTAEGTLDPSRIRVEAQYFPNGVVPERLLEDDLLMAGLNLGLPGTYAIKRNYCFACHQVAAKSIGPAYFDVARKYKDQSDMDANLARKVVEGGVGVWGHTPMPAQPHIDEHEALEMVRAIMDIARKKTISSTGAHGQLKLGPKPPQAEDSHGIYVISASYTDRGLPGLGALAGEAQVILKAPAQ